MAAPTDEEIAKLAPVPPISRDPVGWVSNLVIQGFLGAIRILPYRQRILWGGKFLSTTLLRLTGHRRRVADNLDKILPDLDADERARLIQQVPEMWGRSVLELFSPEEFSAIARRAPITGPGYEALQKAKEEGRPVMLISGHFGNYDVVRANLIDKGYDLGALYRPMNNAFFNRDYLRAILTIGQPLFDRGRAGMGLMVRHLKKGGVVAILIDQHMSRGEKLRFFDYDAYTATSSAKMALKYNAVVIPFYSIRQPDGLTFELVMEAPIAPSDPTTMTQQLNDSLEARVREHMNQWLWMHRRWKTVAPQTPDAPSDEAP